jgi:5-methylcytosine-specific restriction endonuclease McrA
MAKKDTVMKNIRCWFGFHMFETEFEQEGRRENVYYVCKRCGKRKYGGYFETFKHKDEFLEYYEEARKEINK